MTGLETTGTFVLPGGASVLFTTKADGNMSSVGGTDAQDGAGNRERLRLRLGLAALARGYQVHGSAVQIVTAPGQDPPDNDSLAHADGQVTCLEGVGVTVLSADCLPIAVAGEGSVGVLHAGWRGLAAGVLEATLAALGGAGDELIAWLGPAIGPAHYEVGEEVRTAFCRRDARAAAAFAANARGRWQCDLHRLARQRLTALGVQSIHAEARCTYAQPESFYSFRRDGVTGRMGALIWFEGQAR